MTVDIQTAIASFKEAFFDGAPGIESASGRRSSWSSGHAPYLRRLEQIAGDQRLSQQVLLATIETYKPGTRSRQQASGVLGRLARSAGLDLPDEWQECGSGYVARESKDEPALADDLIVESLALIPSLEWKRVYSLIAIYGLRNYEPFFLDFGGLPVSDDPVIHVQALPGRASRVVWPLYRQWIDQLSAGSISAHSDLPSVNTDLKKTTPQQVGRRVSEQFRRYGLPFTASQLRHAWAVRAIKGGIPDTLIAKMLGIDVIRYISQYMPHIEQRDSEQIYRFFLNRRDAF